MKQETLLWLIDDTVRQIQVESEKYKDIIKGGKPFSEAKQVKLKIKTLVEELLLLSDKEHNVSASKTS